VRNQLSDGLPGPERERQLQLIRAFADDQPPDQGFLPGRVSDDVEIAVAASPVWGT
jgi:hypothetical protein